MQTIDFTQLRLRDGDTLLDVGCGEGRHTIGACAHAQITAVGVDLKVRDLCTAQQKFEELLDFLKKADQHTFQKTSASTLLFQQADALYLPFADNSFDKVICSEVLEHIQNYQGVLQEIRRVLKPDGVLAISVPRAWPEEICWKLQKKYPHSDGGHIRIFNATQLMFDVEMFGWRRYARHWAHALHSPFWWLKCCFWNQDQQFLVRWYHKFLVWDLMQKPWLTRSLEWLLNPVLGKSVVMYFEQDSPNKDNPALNENSQHG